MTVMTWMCRCEEGVDSEQSPKQRIEKNVTALLRRLPIEPR